jgi:hypothetical protein
MRITVRALALMTSLVTIPAAAGTAVVFFSQPAASSCTNRDAARGPSGHDRAQGAGLAQFTQPPADAACRLQTPPPPLSGADSQLLPWDPMFPPSPAELRLAPEGQSPGALLRQPRLACEEITHREAALRGYLKSSLRLTPAQKEAWQKVELAAEPAVNRQRELCEQLPLELASPHDLFTLHEFAEKIMSARLDRLRATREPLRALVSSLSPEQRAPLARPPLLLPGPF